MGSFTGFDPTRATNDMDNFTQAMMDIFNGGKQAFETYNTEMYNSWASPQAKANNGDLINYPAYISEYIRTMHNAITSTAISAIQNMAKANGTQFSYPFQPITEAWEKTELRDSFPDGQVGMMESKVDSAVNNFVSSIKDIETKMDSLPNNLSLFDKQDNLLQLYKKLIDQYKAKIDEVAETTIDTVKRVKEHETNTLRSAVTHATDTLTM